MKKLIFITIGILFAIVGFYIFKKGDAKVKRCTAETQGTVVEIVEKTEKNQDGDYEYVYYPVISYQANNETVTKQSSFGYSSQTKLNVSDNFAISLSHSKYRINDSIKVLYNPNNIEEFVLEGEKNNSYIMGIVFIILGSLVAILGIFKPIE